MKSANQAQKILNPFKIPSFKLARMESLANQKEIIQMRQVMKAKAKVRTAKKKKRNILGCGENTLDKIKPVVLYLDLEGMFQ